MNDQKYDYECPACGFKSVGHSTKKAANARGQEHKREHELTDKEQ